MEKLGTIPPKDLEPVITVVRRRTGKVDLIRGIYDLVYQNKKHDRRFVVGYLELHEKTRTWGYSFQGCSLPETDGGDPTFTNAVLEAIPTPSIVVVGFSSKRFALTQAERVIREAVRVATFNPEGDTTDVQTETVPPELSADTQGGDG